MSSLPKPRFTPEEYLEMERQAPYKSEYISGEIFAITHQGGYPGASRAHIRIATNIASAFNVQLRGRPCETYNSDMKVQAGPRSPYFYPDVVVVCGEPHFLDEQGDVLLNPTVIVEVLSRSTEAFDRGEKSAYYRSLESVQDVLLVSQWQYHIEHFVRQAEGPWLFSEVDGIEATVDLPSIGCRLTLSEVYDKTGLQIAPESEEPG